MQTVLIAGGSGLVGSRLSNILRGNGYNVIWLSRKGNINADFPTYAWDIQKGYIDEKAIQQADYVVNLAGSGIADKRWSAARKKDIIDSRVQSTLLLKQYLLKTPNKVKAYISASAIGFYGDRGNDMMTETSKEGSGFLAESTLAWENAVKEIAATSIRTVTLRIGIVMSSLGGALEKILISFMFRTGVYFGNGEQWYSWIHIDDMCHIFKWAIENERAQGVYNGVSPNPLTNYDLTKGIATAKGGGYLMIPTPAFTLRLAMGEMADVVLSGTKVSSQKIENQGFKFAFPDFVPAIQDILERKV
jgi:uncharacterized protein